LAEKESTYKQIFKATSLFGGVQVISILIAIVRNKFVAILLGTTGVGIMSLLQSTINLLSTLTSLGISSSAVRDISEANGTNDTKRISRVITVFRRWVWFTGILGTVLTIVMSPWLSQWTFGNRDYTTAFIFLSCTLLLSELSSGQITLLHGLQKLKDMAKANVIGSAIGLVVSIPIYYWIGVKGIVPTMILSSITALLISWNYSRKVQVEHSVITTKDTIKEGLGMVKLGILMTLSSFISYFVAYLVNAFINRTGSVDDVGLYQAGWSITNKYIGMVFTAMVTDYYPRLSKINHDNVQVSEVVNQQTEIAILILSPILIILLSTAPIVINVLYTSDFLPVVKFIQWVIPGVLFMALSWSLGFIPLAKGDSKLYFLKESLSSVIVLSCYLIGYHFKGLEGLGIAYSVSCFLVYLYVKWICKRKYNFHYSHELRKIFAFHFMMCAAAFLITYIIGYPWGYLTGTVFLLIVGWQSWKTLDKKMGLKKIIKNKLKRN
jgi:O-antigen/teichoic acid export membrane protein